MFYIKEQRNILEMMFPENFEEYNLMLESIGTFVEKKILPYAEKIDKEAIFPRENLKNISKQGIMSMSFPREYNGLGLPYTIYIAALEMISKACASTAISTSVQTMVCEGILNYGSEEQKEKYLKEMGLVEGKRLASFALTEPCCGSDAGAMQTKAELIGNNFILNGSKALITNAGESEVYLVFAKTQKGPSAFLVEKDATGFKIGKNIEKIGHRGTTTRELIFSNCIIPKENLVGSEGSGLEYVKNMLNSGRITIAALAIGIAQAAYEKSLSYSKERKAYGQAISKFQFTQEKLADMTTEINAARMLTYYASWLKSKGKFFASEAAQAKLFASEIATKVCDHAIQIYGGYGYTDEYDVHRHWRDAKLTTIGEGTS
ncbi:MAG: acyl-CoA dehydrogenase family protein, partial [Methanosarcinales archaeon]